EYGLEAAASVASFYLERGYRLGCTVYNGQRQLVYPDTGAKQFMKVSQILTHLSPSNEREGLRAAVERCRGFILAGRPLVVVVTRATEDTEGLVAGIRRVRSFTGRRRRQLPVVVVTPAIYALLPRAPDWGDDAAALLKRLDRPAIARVRSTGSSLVEWDVRRHSFAAAYMRGAR
ncbi:MAG TPA: hypothetical protein VI565_04490, partial [Burkholderiales bacterium]|nr:hypothetical protein [Burkholderiales bacterium]